MFNGIILWPESNFNHLVIISRPSFNNKLQQAEKLKIEQVSKSTKNTTKFSYAGFHDGALCFEQLKDKQPCSATLYTIDSLLLAYVTDMT